MNVETAPGKAVNKCQAHLLLGGRTDEGLEVGSEVRLKDSVLGYAVLLDEVGAILPVVLFQRHAWLQATADNSGMSSQVRPASSRVSVPVRPSIPCAVAGRSIRSSKRLGKASQVWRSGRWPQA